ncbi:hypothetical protein D6Z43_10310 [Pseudomonas sp. DY-1]|uniref:nucleoid-associated protein n=1 Tax=Pseudomonas sp. DY-1 TaxID=1755504 RepID=UPI000EA8FFB5|nr:nucleoid-associated protein [Pseudomonas sp. DY-1]AYF87520.1 hypothetical protein D6Z43_10310 [Pseudomonas sp. DY-1]
MSFLTDEEYQDLKISNMILHVVGDGNFVAEKKRTIEHEEFFIERIRDTDKDAVYSFSEDSFTKLRLEKIAVGEVDFERGAQELSRAFSLQHVGGSRDGAFFVFELTCGDEGKRIYSLIKYDYREVIEQANGKDGSLLRKIVQAFIGDKRAIQKAAIVRISNGVAELQISTLDRARPSPELSDYFAGFLDVTRTRSDEELSSAVKEAVRQTFNACKNLLPEENVPRAIAHAVGLLRERQEVDEDAIVDAVISAAGFPEEEETRVRLQNQARKTIKKMRLDGLRFKPDRRVLTKPPMRKVKTTEGVTITYPDDAGATVERVPQKGGGEKITVTTRKVTEDRILRDSSS